MSISFTRAAAMAAVAAALALAGCGGSSSDSGSTYGGASTSAKPAPKAAKTSVGVANSSLGNILVDGQGRTLYLFEADKSSGSACSGACAQIWPPLMSSGTPAGRGVIAAKLGTTKRSDGTMQVTYGGHPLYTYAGDSGPGQTTGEGSDDFGAEWYVVSRAGGAVEDAA